MAKNYKSSYGGVQFLYNPDGTGETLVRLREPDKDNHDQLRIPTDALNDFVAQIVRDRKMARLAQMTPMQVLTEPV